jgi:3-phosphoshikimate 1-carboxyvinyltransferase
LFDVVQPVAAAVPVLCIDGPTASGKGTVAAAVAARLGYHLLDSGVLYRLTALAARQAGLPLDASGEASIAALAARLPVRFQLGAIYLDDDDVTDAIRTEQAGIDASRVSALPAVRQALVQLQLGFCRLPGLVADGRDMGTVIFPQAPLKVFLTASAAHRAERRHKQLISKGIPAKISDLRADLEARDLRDSTRATAPLKPAEDALLLDSSELTAEESVNQVLHWWQDKQVLPLPGGLASGHHGR